MSPHMQLVCVACNIVQPRGFYPVCGSCGALTNPVYNLRGVRLRKSDNPFKRFSQLLPIRDRSLLPEFDEYTPLVHARNLGRRIGLTSLYLKDETVLPTRTTKYRMAAVALPYLYENGVRHFCTSSTGNSSTAYGSLISDIPELRMTLFTAADFSHRMNFVNSSQIDHFILEGASFAEAFETAGSYGRIHGYSSERGFFNPGRREGLKLAFLEVTDQLTQPIDCYVQAVSSAMGVFGTYSGARELVGIGRITRLPRLMCVQQASCAPMTNAWSEGAESIRTRHIVRKPRGIAEAILRGEPSRVYPYVRRIVAESGGQFAAATEAEIRHARKLLQEDEGLEVCFSAATALAGLIKLVNEGLVAEDETVLVNLTGRSRDGRTVADGVRFRRADGEWCSKPAPAIRFPVVVGNQLQKAIPD